MPINPSTEKLPSQAGRAALLSIAAGRCTSRGLSSPSQRTNHFFTLIALRRRGLVTWDDQLTDAGRAMVLRLTELQGDSNAA